MIQNFYRGDTKKYKIIVRDKATSAPISVDSGTLTFTMKKKLSDSDENAAVQVVKQAIETDPTNPTGEVEIVLSHEDTNIAPGEYNYDFQFISFNNEVTTLFAGKVKVLTDVTQGV